VTREAESNNRIHRAIIPLEASASSSIKTATAKSRFTASMHSLKRKLESKTFDLGFRYSLELKGLGILRPQCLKTEAIAKDELPYWTALMEELDILYKYMN
jgi:hypothetical protein